MVAKIEKVGKRAAKDELIRQRSGGELSGYSEHCWGTVEETCTAMELEWQDSAGVKSALEFTSDSRGRILLMAEARAAVDRSWHRMSLQTAKLNCPKPKVAGGLVSSVAVSAPKVVASEQPMEVDSTIKLTGGPYVRPKSSSNSDGDLDSDGDSSMKNRKKKEKRRLKSKSASQDSDDEVETPVRSTVRKSERVSVLD